MPPTATESAEQPVGFRRRVARQRALLELRLLDLPALEIALIATDPQHPDREFANEELVRRLESQLHDAARNVCRRLSHCGGTCRRHDCDEAFASVMQSLVKRVLGVDGTLLTCGGAVELVKLRPKRAPRTSSPMSTIRRWVASPKRSDVSMHAYVVTELRRANGVTTDARRQWNSDRGLPVRVNLRAEERRILEEQLHRLVERSAEHVAILDDSTPQRDVGLWMSRLYDDACENSGDTGAGLYPVDYRRLSRSVSSSGPPDARRVELLRELVEALLTALGTSDAQRLLFDHFDPAWQLTRGRCDS